MKLPFMPRADFEAKDQEVSALKQEFDQAKADLACKEQEIQRLSADLAAVSQERDVLRSGLAKVKLPGILINTMPKSGSVFIAHTLAHGLRIELMTESVAHGFFPTYFIRPNILSVLSEGNRMRQEHFDASPINLAMVSRSLNRIVLHVRDPRQATLSWAHHAARLLREHPDGVNYTVHKPPADFLSWSFERQLDWQLETHLPSVVAWLRGWVKYDSDPQGIRILWTTFDELIRDEQGFFDRILEFYGIPRELFAFVPAEKSIKYNFRVGRADEWREVFTAEQQRAAGAMIGKDLLDRFGW